jgi:drug/metabolite transporter (DMT)-like permease
MLAFVWGTSFILMKKGLNSFHADHVAAFRVFFSSILLLPFSIRNIRKINTGNIKSLLISGFWEPPYLLALFSSVLSLIVFNTLITHTSAVFSASVTYIIPLFAIFRGIFDSETVTLLQLVWISLILLGVYLVNRNNRT